MSSVMDPSASVSDEDAEGRNAVMPLRPPETEKAAESAPTSSSSVMIQVESPPCPPPSPRPESEYAPPVPPSSPPKPSLVAVTAGYKSYGSRPVLNNLSIDVCQGTIYALLGASGCGKTTLLSCIVGTKRLDSGFITFAGEELHAHAGGLRGAVGYMPQELALYREFTIREALLYFGRIYGMSRAAIEARGQFLVRLLQLPDWGTEIRRMSGGQQRRTSFACALVHSPRLLILDEPTVGVDPLLRKAIWEYLGEIVKGGGSNGAVLPTTVIITTHYIDEARGAATVGLMRSGRILAEGPPGVLMARHGAESLEGVFLVLSQADEDAPAVKVTPLTPLRACGKGRLSLPRLLPHPGYTARLGALVMKNFVYIWRQILFIFFLLLFPALQIFLCCWAIGTEPWALPFGVVNHEVLAGARDCLAPSGNLSRWSCEFVRILDAGETFAGGLREFASEAEASAVMRAEGAIYGYVALSKDFSAQVEGQALGLSFGGTAQSNSPPLRVRPRKPKDTYTAEDAVALRGNGTSLPGAGVPPPLTVQLDQTSRHITISVQKALAEAYQELLTAVRNRSSSAAAVRERTPSAGNGPIQYEPPIYGHSRPTLVVEYVGPGLVLAVIFFAAISITGLSYVVEKREGMLERSIVAGVSPSEIITAHLLSQCLIVVLQAAICLAVLFGVFRVPVHSGDGVGPPTQGLLVACVVALAVLQGFLGMFGGFVLSAVCDEEKVVMQWALAITLPMVVVAGVFWPTAGMPEALQWLGRVFVPQTHAAEAIRSMLGRGWGPTHPKVWPGFAVTVGYSFALWALANVFAARGVSQMGGAGS